MHRIIDMYKRPGDMILVYLKHDPEEQNPENDLIMGVVHWNDYIGNPAVWDNEFEVSDNNGNVKGAQRVDSGMIQMEDPTVSQAADHLIACVWQEEDPNDGWQVFYNAWNFESTPNPNDILQISSPGEFGAINFLPRIDITPARQAWVAAIVTWTKADVSPLPPYTRFHYAMYTATPFLVDSVRPAMRYSRWPDD